MSLIRPAEKFCTAVGTGPSNSDSEPRFGVDCCVVFVSSAAAPDFGKLTALLLDGDETLEFNCLSRASDALRVDAVGFSLSEVVAAGAGGVEVSMVAGDDWEDAVGLAFNSPFICLRRAREARRVEPLLGESVPLLVDAAPFWMAGPGLGGSGGFAVGLAVSSAEPAAGIVAPSAFKRASEALRDPRLSCELHQAGIKNKGSGFVPVDCQKNKQIPTGPGR